MSFEELGLNKELADRLAQNGIIEPSIIQQEVFPILRSGGSVIALSKTGTGKTLAYLAPLVQRYVYDLSSDDPAAKTWGLVLVPTRELAAQAEKNLRLLTDDKLHAVVIVGGESEKHQVTLGAKAAIFVATPGRFLDLLKRKLVNVAHLKCVVFDEADRILDMGFVDEVRTIRQLLPKSLQLSFFSATIHFGIDEMAYEFGVEAQRIGKEQDELTVEGLDHRVAFVGDNEKLHALVNFLKARPGKRGIVFTNYKVHAHQLVRRLGGLGLQSESLTSDSSQAERTKTMSRFRENEIQVLFASDLASRGLDVQDLDFVVNMDLPDDSASYLHRVGRTARAGKKGIALSLVGFEDSFRLEALEKYLGKKIVKFEFYPEELSGALPRLGTHQPEPYTDRAPHPRDSHNRRGSHDSGHARGGHGRTAAPARARSAPAGGVNSRSHDTRESGRPAHAAHPRTAHERPVRQTAPHARSHPPSHPPGPAHKSAAPAHHAAKSAKPASFFGKLARTVQQTVQKILGTAEAAPKKSADSAIAGHPRRTSQHGEGRGARRNRRGGQRHTANGSRAPRDAVKETSHDSNKDKKH